MQVTLNKVNSMRKLIPRIPTAEEQMNGAKVPRKSRLFDPDHVFKFAEDPTFVPPPTHTSFYGKPMEIVSDKPAAARRRKERSFSVGSTGTEYAGRPPTTPTAEQLHERFVDTTFWLDGEWFTDDIATPLPLSKRHPLDPEHLVTCISLLEYWLERTIGPQIRVVIRDVKEPLKLLPPNTDNKKILRWTAKRLSFEELHRALHDMGTASAYRLADMMLGPFESVVEHRHARRKVQDLLTKLKKRNFVDNVLDNDGNLIWSSIRDPSIPLPCQPATLFTSRPELKKGRYCVTTEGEALLKEWAEDEQQDFEEHVGRIAAVMDMRVGFCENDDEHSDDPMPRKRVHQSYYHVRCNLIRAYDVLTGIRKGQYAPDGKGGPTLCYFKFWARMLYAPIPSGSGDWMLDERASRIPDPTVAEARYIEQKAFGKLRELETRGLVVRRRAPDGSTILFENTDPECANYPLVDNAVRAP
jgi:hypothetical protein